MTGAELFVKCLEKLEIDTIFCVPGASIDPILNVLAENKKIKVIVCRHEQNAAFMAQCYGKITKRPAICLATAGPGVTNLVTGVATAFCERSPMIAISGQIAQNYKFKKTHQSVDAKNLLDPITKWSENIDYLDSLPAIMANAKKIATEPKMGPVHISIPYNLQNEKTKAIPLDKMPQTQASAKNIDIEKTAKKISASKKPILFLGCASSRNENATAIRSFLKKFPMPVVATFEAAGAISRDLEHLFLGRLGVFKNQVGDIVLKNSDLIICVGFDPVEYDPQIWNKQNKKDIINIDTVSSTLDYGYEPQIELLGDIAQNLKNLSNEVREISNWCDDKIIINAKEKLQKYIKSGKDIASSPVHPLKLIYELREFLSDDVTVISDVGSHQYWLARNYFCYEPRHFITSMGMQTMGVALPFAIATALVRPNKKVLSISGDGSFYMSSMELETAVRLKLPIVHMVWEDESYNLVKIQQDLKYGKNFASSFGKIDTIKYAEAFGAIGYKIKNPDQIQKVLKDAFSLTNQVAVISVDIDYKDNMDIVKTIQELQE
jgi:acetolactate synthase I/II/III large subunit